ncbi:MAG: hypothetical protein JWN80_1305 [Microbacteriaceae bacterium]|jgi:hypothetical protein|nr:hypothetical protein [Microbacteriaceae bacterium]
MSDPTTTLPVLRFRLPGQWWPIPLRSESTAKASIKALVDTVIGVADDRAILRDSMRKQLFESVEKAVAGGGQSMYIAQDVIEEVPLSASFTVILPGQGMTPAIGEEGAGVIEILRRGLEQADPNSAPTFVEFDANDSRVLRSHSIRPGQDDPPALPALTANYWISVPGTKRVVLVSFLTAYAELEAVMLTFFDSIVRATYWEDPASI